VGVGKMGKSPKLLGVEIYSQNNGLGIRREILNFGIQLNFDLSSTDLCHLWLCFDESVTGINVPYPVSESHPICFNLSTFFPSQVSICEN
jgi:hypothetical protein